MRPLIVIQRVWKIDFMRWHLPGFVFSLVLTALTIGAFLTLLGNLLADVGYALADPRIRQG